MSELKKLAAKIPNHLVVEKCLWVGDNRVEIDHIDGDLSNGLDYIKAFKEMIRKLENQIAEPKEHA